MSRSGYVPSWTCPEVAMSRNGYVPIRLCPKVAMSRNGYVPKGRRTLAHRTLAHLINLKAFIHLSFSVHNPGMNN